jgi:putative transposase
VKYAWIDEHRDQYSVTRMCRQLEVSRTGYGQWRTRPPSDRALANAVLDAQVAAMHAGSQRSYGRPRIVRGLRAQGVPVSHERVRKSLQRQGLRPVYRRPYRVTTDATHHNPIAPNVLDRRVDGWHVNQAWVGDITYIATGEGWLYLACVMDLASHRIVGWSVSDRLKADFVCQALQSAYWRRHPPGGPDHAFGPRQPVRERPPPAVAHRLPHDSIDEQEGQLLGQRGDGELLQDPEGRAHAFVDRLQDTGRC